MVPLVISVRDIIIVPYTMSVYLLQIHTKAQTLPSANESQEASNHSIQGKTSIPAICPVQKVKMRGKNGHFTEALAMLDSDSSTSFISKKVMKKLGICGPKTHLTMNLAGGQ